MAIEIQASTGSAALDHVRVLIVDDHAFFREGVRQLIENQDDMRVVGEAGDGWAAVSVYRDVLPDVTLLDLQMPNMDGFGALGQILQANAEAKVIIVTTYSCEAEARRALVLGASGYVLKSGLHRHLLAAIRHVLSGDRWVDPAVAIALKTVETAGALTAHDVKILDLSSQGLGEKPLAQALSLSKSELQARIGNIIAVLQVGNLAEAVSKAARRGLLAR